MEEVLKAVGGAEAVGRFFSVECSRICDDEKMQKADLDFVGNRPSSRCRYASFPGSAITSKPTPGWMRPSRTCKRRLHANAGAVTLT